MSDPEGSSIKWSTFMCTEAAVYEQTTRKETCSWLQSRVCGLMEKPNGLLFFIPSLLWEEGLTLGGV